MTASKYLSIEEAKKRCGASYKKILAAIADKTLPAHPVGHTHAIETAALDQWAADNSLDLRMPDDLTLDAIKAEVFKARTKFPGSRYNFTALVEEVGELAKALLQRKDKDEIEREAIQVAAMAVRMIEEGDLIYADVTADEAKP